jgi:transcriptional regulator with XRE-family HTH domain
MAYGPLTFGAFINSIRLGEGWTLEQMAAKLDVSPQHICDIEKGGCRSRRSRG